MPTFTELLPPTRTEHAAGFDWTPGEAAGTGVLCIKQKRVYCGYRVTEFRCDWDGRAFRMDKSGEGADPESDSYDVFCSRGGQGHQCSCKGFAYGRGKPCKHIAAGLALIANGWL